MDAITTVTIFNAEGSAIRGYQHPEMYDLREHSNSDTGEMFPSYEASQDSDLGNGNGRLITVQGNGMKGGPYNQSLQVYIPEGDLNGFPEYQEIFGG